MNSMFLLKVSLQAFTIALKLVQFIIPRQDSRIIFKMRCLRKKEVPKKLPHRYRYVQYKGSTYRSRNLKIIEVFP